MVRLELALGGRRCDRRSQMSGEGEAAGAGEREAFEMPGVKGGAELVAREGDPPSRQRKQDRRLRLLQSDSKISPCFEVHSLTKHEFDLLRRFEDRTWLEEGRRAYRPLCVAVAIDHDQFSFGRLLVRCQLTFNHQPYWSRDQMETVLTAMAEAAPRPMAVILFMDWQSRVTG